MGVVRILAVAAAVVAGVGLGAWLAGRGSGSSSPPVSTATVPTTSASVPGKLAGAYLVAGRARDVVVGLAARRGGPVDIVVIPSNLEPVPAGAVQARTRDGAASSRPCGRRCFRFPLRVLDGRRERLTVTVEGRPVVFDLPARVPPSANGLFRTSTARMAKLDSLRVDESLSSGRSELRAQFVLQAPDRIRYVTSAGQRAVVIGTTRWDREQNRWRRSQYQRIRQPAYMWTGARHPRLLGRTTIGGRPVRIVAAFRQDDTYPAWFRLYITPDRRIVRGEMIAPAHFMTDRLSGFNRQPPIRPPS